MVMARADFPALLQAGLFTVFDQNYNEHPTEYDKVFKIETSKKAYEEIPLVYGLGAAVEKPEGSGVTYDEGGQSWTARFVNKTYALAYQITEEAIEDNLYMDVGSRYTKYLARSIKQTKELVHANILNRAFNSSYAGGDGKELLATDHPLAGGGTFQNELSTAADLSEAALEELGILIRKAVDDRNIPISLSSEMLIVPPDLMYVAERLTKTQARPNTADNDVNAMVTTGMFPKGYFVMTRLTDADAFFIKTNAMEGLTTFERVPVQRKTEGDFNTGNSRFKGRCRFSTGWIDPRGCYGSPGA